RGSWVLAAHFSPVREIDRTTWRWKIRKSTSRGTTAIVVAAMTRVQLPVYWFCRLAVATVSTHQVSSLVIISGHRKLFQCVTTVMTASVDRIGLLIGTITCQMIRNV